MKDTFQATIQNGELSLGSDFNKARFRDWLKQNEGKRIKITKENPKRTLSQNSFYWLYLGVIERELGQDANDAHEYFKRTLLPPKFIKVLGKEIKIPKSTTELTKSEMGDYLDKISALTEVAIPNPQDVGFYTENN